MSDDLSPQGRAGKAVYLLLTYGEMTSDELMTRLEYKKKDGLVYLMEHLAKELPLLEHNTVNDSWQIVDGVDHT